MAEEEEVHMGIWHFSQMVKIDPTTLLRRGFKIVRDGVKRLID